MSANQVCKGFANIDFVSHPEWKAFNLMSLIADVYVHMHYIMSMYLHGYEYIDTYIHEKMSIK